MTAERQVRRVRTAYLAALLRQDIAFYDTHKGGELAARLTEDALSMIGGMGAKVTSTLHFTATFVGGLVVGFTSSWQLTLVVFAAVPFIIVIMGFLSRITVSFESRMAAAYARAGNSANETIANIRTVFAYNGAATEAERYDAHLAVAARAGEGKGWLVGAAVGSIVREAILCAYVVACPLGIPYHMPAQPFSVRYYFYSLRFCQYRCGGSYCTVARGAAGMPV